MGNEIKGNRQRMDRENRAKQFMPFDALKGLREALAAKEKIIVPKKELSEEQKELLDYRLQELKVMDMVTVEYFHKGEYLQMTGVVSKIDLERKTLTVVNREIRFADISELK